MTFKRQRAAYLTAMRRADAGDSGALGELMALAMANNLDRFIVPDVAVHARRVGRHGKNPASHPTRAQRCASTQNSQQPVSRRSGPRRSACGIR
jgi:cell filamentation protein, protein adenylyltransferase